MDPTEDLRGYLARLADLDEVRTVDKPVDPDLELGAITRHCYETGAPAPLFTQLTRGNPGFRVLGAPAGPSRRHGHELARAAVSLGLPSSARGQDIVAALADARTREVVPPRTVDGGPCKDNIVLGEDVDLDVFPIPLLHEGDGGRYFNTWGTLIVADPEGRWTNWTIARVMVHDKRTLVGLIVPSQHIGQIFAQWRERGEPMPFAIAQGGHPAIPFACAMPIPRDVDEAAYVGAYLGAPLEVVRCETNGLHVPANAEIVVEGHVDLVSKAPEGPMGEYTGYLAKEPSSGSLMHVDAVTYRNQAILPIVAAGEPVDETHVGTGIGAAAEGLHQLRAAGIPVTTCWVPFESALTWLVVTVPGSWHEDFDGTSTELTTAIATNVFHSKVGSAPLVVVVTYDDIDPTDLKALVWAMASRTHPHDGVIFFPDETVSPLPPVWTAAERRGMRAAKVAYNALFGDEYVTRADLPRRSSFAHCYPAELQEQVLRQWRSYGLDIG